MEIIFIIISILLGTTVLICVGIFVYNLFQDESNLLYQALEWERLSLGNKVIIIGSYIGFTIAFQQGALFSMTWMPGNWGTFDGNDFTPLKFSLSFLGAILGAVTVGGIVELYRFRLFSILDSEKSKYKNKINNATANFNNSVMSDSKAAIINDVKSEIANKIEVNKKYLTRKKPLNGEYYQYIQQEKLRIYQNLLKRMESQNYN